jgi:hypothetical protein
MISHSPTGLGRGSIVLSSCLGIQPLYTLRSEVERGGEALDWKRPALQSRLTLGGIWLHVEPGDER